MLVIGVLSCLMLRGVVVVCYYLVLGLFDLLMGAIVSGFVLDFVYVSLVFNLLYFFEFV